MSNIRDHAKNVDKMGNLKLQPVPEGSGNKPGKKLCAFNLSRTVDARGSSPLYGFYRYVRPQRVWFFSRFGHK